MKRLFVVGLLTFGLTVLLCIPAEGSGCRTVHRCAAPVRVVEEKVVEAVAVVPVVSAFLPAAVVAYGAAYAPGSVYPGAVAGAQAAQVQQPGQQSAFLAGIQRLEQRLGAIEQRVGIAAPQAQVTPMPAADATHTTQQEQAPPAQGQAGADVLKLFTARCASCHQKGREGSGGGFVLLDGPRLVSLSVAKQKDVLQRVYSTDPKRAMPRGGKGLSDEELSVVISWIATN